MASRSLMRLRLRIDRCGLFRGRGGIVDHVLKFFAGLEVRNLLGGNLDAGAGFWIASDARLPPPRRAFTMLSKMDSTMTSDSLRVISTTRETSSIRSALVIFTPPC